MLIYNFAGPRLDAPLKGTSHSTKPWSVRPVRVFACSYRGLRRCHGSQGLAVGVSYRRFIACLGLGASGQIFQDRVGPRPRMKTTHPAAVRCDMVLHQAFRVRRVRYIGLGVCGATWCYIGCFVRDI